MQISKILILFFYILLGFSQAMAMDCGWSAKNFEDSLQASFSAQKDYLNENFKNRQELRAHLLNPGKSKRIKDFKKIGDVVSPNGVSLFESPQSLLYVEKKDGAVREWLSFEIFTRFKSRPKKLYMPEAVLTEDLVFRHLYIPETKPKHSWKNYFSWEHISKSAGSYGHATKEMVYWLELFNFLIGNLDIKDDHFILGKNREVFLIDFAYSFWSVLDESPLHYQKRSEFMMSYFEEPQIDLKIPIVRRFVQELQSGLGEEILNWFTSQELVYKMLRKEKEIDPFLERLDYLMNLSLD
ncbi:MAG: hypothetical protein CL674_17230 [Bdellovibrionaceae bacterium]|nr:hypothetical protein [Pseudobdellovibrionaceae bacterium]